MNTPCLIGRSQMSKRNSERSWMTMTVMFQTKNIKRNFCQTVHLRTMMTPSEHYLNQTLQSLASVRSCSKVAHLSIQSCAMLMLKASIRALLPQWISILAKTCWWRPVSTAKWSSFKSEVKVYQGILLTKIIAHRLSNSYSSKTFLFTNAISSGTAKKQFFLAIEDTSIHMTLLQTGLSSKVQF